MCTYCIYTIFSIDSYYFYIRSYPYIALSFCRSSFNIRERIKSFGPSSSCSRSDLVLMVLEDLRVFFSLCHALGSLTLFRCSLQIFSAHDEKFSMCRNKIPIFARALLLALSDRFLQHSFGTHNAADVAVGYCLLLFVSVFALFFPSL